MLPWGSCELVQSMEIWVRLTPFPLTLCCFFSPCHLPPRHVLCPAGEQAHPCRERLSPHAWVALSSSWLPLPGSAQAVWRLSNEEVRDSSGSLKSGGDGREERSCAPSPGFLPLMVTAVFFGAVRSLAGSAPSLATSESSEMNLNRSRTRTGFVH